MWLMNSAHARFWWWLFAHAVAAQVGLPAAQRPCFVTLGLGQRAAGFRRSGVSLCSAAAAAGRLQPSRDSSKLHDRAPPAAAPRRRSRRACPSPCSASRCASNSSYIRPERGLAGALPRCTRRRPHRTQAPAGSRATARALGRACLGPHPVPLAVSSRGPCDPRRRHPPHARRHLLSFLGAVVLDAEHVDQRPERQPLADQRRQQHRVGQEDDQVPVRQVRAAVGVGAVWPAPPPTETAPRIPGPAAPPTAVARSQRRARWASRRSIARIT